MNQLVHKFANNIELQIKREDLLHPYISGNKFRKLKYNLLEAKEKGFKKFITFGGAFSNHISAASYAGFLHSFETIGVIRGEELESKIDENPTLTFAQKHGMKFYFVSREQYREKTNPDFISFLEEKFGEFYLVPEGGTNELAVKGCEEILTSEDECFDYICSAIGTGGTISGLINTAKSHQKVLGFPALKGDFLKDEIQKWVSNNRWDLIDKYHFSGYGKYNQELIAFINKFYAETKIPLDPIYTGKMLFGLYDMIENNYFRPGTKILAIHTGGLQGIEGMNMILKKKNLPIIDVL